MGLPGSSFMQNMRRYAQKIKHKFSAAIERKSMRNTSYQSSSCARPRLSNECYPISLQLKDAAFPDEEKAEMKLKLAMHLNEANTQRRSMDAYITALEMKIAPDDPKDWLAPDSE